MSRPVHRAFIEEGLDRQAPGDVIVWTTAVCHVTHRRGFAAATDETSIAKALGWLDWAGCPDAEHIL